MSSTLRITALFVLGLFYATSVGAQERSFMYKDESGNIYFVDSLDKVPNKYRNQLVAPTATPYMNEKQYDRYMKDYQSGRLQKKQLREMEKQRKLKEREAKKKEREDKKKQREKEKEDRKAEKTQKKTVPDNADPRGGTKAQISTSVELLVASNCPDCRAAERLLSRHGVNFTKYDVEKSAQGKRIYAEVGGGDLPMVSAAGKVLKGFNQEAIARMLGFELSPQERKK